jgi:hypothetical protein
MPNQDFEGPQYVEIDLQFVRGDAPQRSFYLRERDALTGTYGPLVLTGSIVTLIGKANPDDADAQALYSYSSGGVGPRIVIDDDGSDLNDKASKVTVSWNAADVDEAGKHVYRLRVDDDTVVIGDIVIEAR